MDGPWPGILVKGQVNVQKNFKFSFFFRSSFDFMTAQFCRPESGWPSTSFYMVNHLKLCIVVTFWLLYFSTDRAVLRPPPLLEIRQKSVDDEQHRREVANKMMKFTGISGRSASVDNRWIEHFIWNIGSKVSEIEQLAKRMVKPKMMSALLY